MSQDPGTELFWNFGIVYGFNGSKRYKNNSHNYICKYFSRFEEFISAQKFLYKFTIAYSSYTNEILNNFATFVILSFHSFSKSTRLNLRFHIIFPRLKNM